MTVVALSPTSVQVRELEAELEELRSTMDALKATLEAETLSKVDLQNHIQSLKEEMAFKRKVHEEVCGDEVVFSAHLLRLHFRRHELTLFSPDVSFL